MLEYILLVIKRCMKKRSSIHAVLLYSYQQLVISKASYLLSSNVTIVPHHHHPFQLSTFLQEERPTVEDQAEVQDGEAVAEAVDQTAIYLITMVPYWNSSIP